MLENSEIKIVECKYGEREDIIKFLVQITSEEFGFTYWKDYFEHKLVEKYKTGNNKFWIVLNKENEIIGTCGGLQQTDKIIKFNCFYINAEYRNLGIGTDLLNQFLTTLKADGYSKISLSVQKENYAVKLYTKVGFMIVNETEEEYIMLINLL